MKDAHDEKTLAQQLGAPDQRTTFTLERGQTFWRLCEIKYEGKHPIDAIFEANGLIPAVLRENEQVSFIDPIYYCGQAYVFPAHSEIPALQQKFWQKMEELGAGGNVAQRVGEANARTAVCLRWDETLGALAQTKYKGDHPINALYEANGMVETVAMQNGEKKLQQPICYAGRSYIFPAQSELEELGQRYENRMQAVLQSEENI